MNTNRLVPFVLLTAAAALAPAQAPSPAAAAATPAAALQSTILPFAPRGKPARYRIPLGYEPRLITVKFRDGLAVRLRDGALTDLGTGALAAAGEALAASRGGTWTRAQALSEAQLDELRARGERNVGFPLHDLNLQFRCALPAGTDGAAVIDAWNALDCVERAEAVPLPMAPPQAPDVRSKQGYADSAPRGTGAGPLHGLGDNSMMNNLAATGGHARIADIEYGFDQGHADLPPVALLTPPGAAPAAWITHGTAVLGMLGSRSDGWGTTGLAPAAQYSFAHATNPAGAWIVDSSISLAANAVGAGGVVLIEQQIAGPRWNGQATSQVGMLPVEWYYPAYLAIRNAVAAGVVVVEAAGNGAQDLDDPFYGGWFAVPYDSGALMVGAGAAPGGTDVARSRLGFSNFGSTLDLQGWGEKVVTTGYGDLWAAGGPAQHYTQVFSGTSSASPCVAGAAAMLQSVHFERRMTFLMPHDLRAALRRSGSPQQNGGYPVAQNIGPLPDAMRAALELRLYFGMHAALGFQESLPGNGGNGIEFTPGNTEAVRAMVEFDDDGPGPNPTRLYVGGHFRKLGNVVVNNVACWTGFGWQALGGGVSMSSGLYSEVYALAVHDPDGAGPQPAQLYAGGLFDRASGLPVGSFARWNGTSWSAVGAGASSVGAGVFALLAHDEDGPGPLPQSLIVGGSFSSIGGVAANSIARWRGNAWSAMGSGFDNYVQALEVFDADGTGPFPGQIVAGGRFQYSGGAPARGLATWNGFSWTELGGVGFWGDQVNCLEAVEMPASGQHYLFVGGTFFSIAGQNVGTQGVAIWNGYYWILPTGLPPQPVAMAAFDFGLSAAVPRQKAVVMSSYAGLFRVDPWSWATTPLPLTATFAEGMFVHDEDGVGGEPPALLLGGNVFGGSAPSAGLAKLFAMLPSAGASSTQVRATSCGGPYTPTIATTNDPVLGVPFTVQFDCLPQSLPLLCVGVPHPVPLPICGAQASCALGVQPLVYLYGQKSVTYTFPNDPAFTGIYFGFQGLELMALPFGPRCAPPSLPIDLRASDTLVLTF